MNPLALAPLPVLAAVELDAIVEAAVYTGLGLAFFAASSAQYAAGHVQWPEESGILENLQIPADHVELRITSEALH